MPIFPKIQSPCPYKSQLAAVMDGDFCRMCNRTVVDLTAMSDGERVAFLSGCEEEVCVSFRLPRAAVGAAALAAAALAVPSAAAAQEAPAVELEQPLEAEAVPEEDIWMDVGGIKDPANVEYVETAEDLALPELPVVYEEDPAPAASVGAPAVSSRAAT
jgi:predicted Fe-S protein YdhL (DUF1289 family)